MTSVYVSVSTRVRPGQSSYSCTQNQDISHVRACSLRVVVSYQLLVTARNNPLERAQEPALALCVFWRVYHLVRRR